VGIDRYTERKKKYVGNALDYSPERTAKLRICSVTFWLLRCGTLRTVYTVCSVPMKYLHVVWGMKRMNEQIFIL